MVKSYDICIAWPSLYLSSLLCASVPMCLYVMVIDHIEGGLAPILSSRVVHWRANAGILISYPIIFNITII